MEIIVEDISSYVKDIAKVPKALAIIRDVCRARPGGYQFMPRYRKGYWDGYVSLMHSMNKFPTGLLWLVSKRLQAEGFHLTFTLTSDYIDWHPVEPDMLGGITLRDYQIAAVEKLLDRKRGIAKMATNAGKTEVMAGIIKALGVPNTLIIVSSKELLHQTAKRFEDRLGVEVGKIGDSVWQPNIVTVAMVQTLYSRLKNVWLENQLLMVDECFVAGTLVDGIPIESIEVGDYVTAYDELNNAFCKRIVKHKFVNACYSDLVKINCGDNSIVCTLNHKVFTRRGWVFAKDIDCQDEIGVYRENMYLRKLLSRIHYQRHKRLLFKRVYDNWCAKISLCHNVKNEQEICKCKDEDKESIIQSRNAEENKQYHEETWVQTKSEGRKRCYTATTAKNVGGSVTVGYGSCCADKNEERVGIPYLLQNRCCESRLNDWCGSRWRKSSSAIKSKFRQEKRHSVNFVRVENVEIFKQGDTERFREVCGDGKVYNIETDISHTYVANSVIVHNCHHASSNRMLDVLNKISGPYRFGFSGTPMKYDVLSDMKLISATGRLLCEVTNSQLIEAGYSATPTVHISTVTNDANDMYEADYQTAYKEMIVSNEYRNLLISGKAKASEGMVLVLVNQIEHGRILESMIPGALFVNGSDDTAYRFSILEKMRSGGKGVFIASPIFDEGVDVPAIDTIILACGGKSHIKLLQRIGRGMRKKDNGNVLTIHDFIDDTNKYLLRHSEERIDTYVEEGFETVLE